MRVDLTVLFIAAPASAARLPAESGQVPERRLHRVFQSRKCGTRFRQRLEPGIKSGCALEANGIERKSILLSKLDSPKHRALASGLNRTPLLIGFFKL